MFWGECFCLVWKCSESSFLRELFAAGTLQSLWERGGRTEREQRALSSSAHRHTGAQSCALLIIRQTSAQRVCSSTAIYGMHCLGAKALHAQALVRPYLDSKFSLLSTPVPQGVIFWTARGNTFQKWMYNWPRQLTIYHATGLTSVIWS